MNIKYMWRTVQEGCWDLVKGNHDRLIEVKVKIKVLKKLTA